MKIAGVNAREVGVQDIWRCMNRVVDPIQFKVYGDVVIKQSTGTIRLTLATVWRYLRRN